MANARNPPHARRIRWFGLLLAILIPPAAPAQSATDLTVRLFYTHTVTALSLTPRSATMQLCATCAKTLVPSPLEVTTQPGAAPLLVAGRSSTQLLLEGELRITTPEGQRATAAGHWRIFAAPEGLHILLTLPSERYVMAVLASEAAPDEPPESLKALAVAARSFALTNPHRHGIEGICDSTHCQALRLDAIPDRIANAVHATAGETLWLGGRQVPAYFTQDCGGTTEDAATLWGGAPKPWLMSHQDPWCQRKPAHWYADVAATSLRDALAAEGFQLAAPLTAARILQRDPSGRAHTLELLAGSQHLSIPAGSFRFAVNRSLGWNTLRSDWYTVSFARDHLSFDGKGYGHGVGLCQAGAAAMAQQGKTYRDILSFYFPHAEVRINPTDTGWHTYDAHGWTLRSTSPQPAILIAGDAALSRAQTLFPTQPRPIILTLYPATELFRQSTGEPGWALAATSGSTISLQPLPILARSSNSKLASTRDSQLTKNASAARAPDAELLLHEFLHTMVESQSSAATPLWFREGLVEALTTPHLTAEPHPMPLAQAEAALHHANSLQEAERAHTAAALAVQKLIAAYGLPTVRTWLHNGLPPNILAKLTAPQ